MIQIGGDLHNDLISNTTVSCCRNVHGECFEFNGRSECQNKISTLTCLPCAKNFSSQHCASGRFDNFDMQYADVESHETKMFELRIQRVHSNIIDPLSCKSEEAFSSEASREGCEVGMKLMADIDVNGIESCSDLNSTEMKSACQNVMKVNISLYRGTVLAPQKAKELLGSTQVYADDGSYSINRHAFKDYWVKVDLHHDLIGRPFVRLEVGAQDSSLLVVESAYDSVPRRIGVFGDAYAQFRSICISNQFSNNFILFTHDFSSGSAVLQQYRKGKSVNTYAIARSLTQNQWHTFNIRTDDKTGAAQLSIDSNVYFWDFITPFISQINGGIGVFAKGDTGSFARIRKLSVSSRTYRAVSTVDLETIGIPQSTENATIEISNLPLPVLSGPWNIAASLSGNKHMITKNALYSNFVI